MATIKPQAPGTPIDTRVDNKPAPPVDAVEQAALDAQNNGGDMPPAGYKYGDTMDSSTGKPELIKAPVVTTTEIRNKAQENADYINNKATGGKTVVSTSTSNGKTTTTYSDGTTTTTDSGISPTSGTPTRQDNLNETKNIYDEQEQLQADTNKRYDDLKVSSDEAYNQLVENTKKQFEITRTKLNDSNRRYEGKTKQLQYLNNGFRYTPQQSEGMLYDVEQAGIAKLGELNLQESRALNEALIAKNNNDYKALAEQTNAIRNIQNDRLNTIAQMNNQIKVIEDTDKSIRNMNTNEASIMQSMINSYTLTSREMPASDTDKYYEDKAKELTELMGFNVAKEFVKAQVEGSKAEAAITYSDALSKKNGYHSDVYGRPMLNAEGKTIPLEKEDWGTWKEGNTLNVGTYDENGNKIIKAYELSGAEAESYADTIKNMPQTQVNSTTFQLSQVFQGPMSELLNTPDGTFVPTTNPAYKNIGKGGMQCAEFVNRVTGTSFASGKAANTDAPNTLQVGSIASWMPNGAGEYGHAGIIVGEEGDNWIIKSANLRGNGIISVDSVPKSAIKGGHTPKAVKDMPMEVSGVYDANQDKNLTPIGQNAEGGLFKDNTTGQEITGNQANELYGKPEYSDSDIELLANLANLSGSELNTALKAQGIPMRAVTDYTAKAKAGKIPPTESQKASSRQILSQIQDLVGMDWNDATGMWRWGPAGSDRATAQGKIDSLIAAITLPNLGMLKGPMSDKDLAFIQNASTRLNSTQSDAQFEKQLVELYNISARKNGMKEITKLSEIPKDKITAEQSVTIPTTTPQATATQPPSVQTNKNPAGI